MKSYRIYMLIIVMIVITACKENPTEQMFELSVLLTEEMVNNASLYNV